MSYACAVKITKCSTTDAAYSVEVIAGSTEILKYIRKLSKIESAGMHYEAPDTNENIFEHSGSVQVIIALRTAFIEDEIFKEPHFKARNTKASKPGSPQALSSQGTQSVFTFTCLKGL